MRARIAEELALARKWYPDIKHVGHAGEDWFLLPQYACPMEWAIDGEPVSQLAIAFRLSASYPQTEPYGFATANGITFRGVVPENAGASLPAPFEGEWRLFSWAPEAWSSTAQIEKGSNLLAWIRSFATRFGQGA